MRTAHRYKTIVLLTWNGASKTGYRIAQRKGVLVTKEFRGPVRARSGKTNKKLQAQQ